MFSQAFVLIRLEFSCQSRFFSNDIRLVSRQTLSSVFPLKCIDFKGRGMHFQCFINRIRSGEDRTCYWSEEAERRVVIQSADKSLNHSVLQRVLRELGSKRCCIILKHRYNFQTRITVIAARNATAHFWLHFSVRLHRTDAIFAVVVI